MLLLLDLNWLENRQSVNNKRLEAKSKLHPEGRSHESDVLHESVSVDH